MFKISVQGIKVQKLPIHLFFVRLIYFKMSKFNHLPQTTHHTKIDYKKLQKIAKIAKPSSQKNNHQILKQMPLKATARCKKVYKEIQKKSFKIAHPPSSTISRTKITISLLIPKILLTKFFIPQSINNQPFIPTSYCQPQHLFTCTCGVRQYPWHDLDSFTLETKKTIAQIF